MSTQVKTKNMSDEIEELFTIEETAKKLRISEPYLYKIMKKNEITPLKIGRRTLFTKESIKEFIDKNKDKA